MVEIAARLEIQPEVKASAAGFAVQVGEFGLELDDRIVGAGNVAGAAGPGAMRARRADRGLDHVGVAAHAEIVVRAPHGHFARITLRARRAPLRHWEPARLALEIGEGAVAPLRLEARDRLLEAPVIIHRRSFSAPRLFSPAPLSSSLTGLPKLVQSRRRGGRGRRVALAAPQVEITTRESVWREKRKR